MKQRNKYHWAGTVGSVIFLILLIVTINIGWNLTGQILGVLTLFAGVMGIGTFVKPDVFGPLMTKWLDNLQKNFEDGGNTQSQNRPMNSPQVMTKQGDVHISQIIYAENKK